MIYFETERLVFRDWKESDLGVFRTMNKDPRVMEYFTKMQKIYSFTSKINFPSENVMKKIGLLKAGEFEHPNISEGNPLRRHLLYCLDAIHRGEILH